MAFADWLAVFKGLATNLVVAVVILLIGIVISKLLERLVHKLLHELDVDKWLRKSGVRFALEQTVSNTVKYAGYLLTIIIALNQINLTGIVANIVAVIVIILLLAAIFLGVKDFIPNFIAGLRIHQRGFVKEGDIIRVRDIEGEVRQINLLDTRIKTYSGDLLFVPNSILTKHEVLRHKRKKTMLK